MKGCSTPRTKQNEEEEKLLENLRFSDLDGTVSILADESSEKERGISIEIKLYHQDVLEIVRRHCGYGRLPWIKRLQAVLLEAEASVLKSQDAQDD